MYISDIDLKEIIEKETGQQFNRSNKTNCMFHPDKNASFSIRFNSNTNKYQYKCFGCGEGGDAIDFIMKYKNLSYIETKKYLGLPVEKSEAETQGEKIEKYIDWELTKYRNGQILLGLFPFVNDKGETVYFKAKFANDKGEKTLSYYHIENGKVINKRNGEELPYNLYNAMQGIKDNKIIIICEGEKDANTLNYILPKSRYVATSVKGVKDLSILKSCMIFVCGDTGEAGEKYVQWIKNKLFESSSVFRIINLPGIKDLGDNKDVTDWMEAGHDKNDLFKAFQRSLDLKSKYELQQDWKGIYKTIFKGDDSEEHKTYITNFNVLEASNIKFVEENKEGVKLTLKSSLQTLIKRTGEVTVFDDVKTFKNFLNSMELGFMGKNDDLTKLKVWIKTYFAIQDEEIHAGTKFMFNKNNELELITTEGTLTINGFNDKIASDCGANIDILNVEPINKGELQEIIKYIFDFTSLEKSYSIIGTVINNMAIAQAIRSNVKLHHLLIAGESGCGKSTILEAVIKPILNSKDEPKSIGLITKFALTKDLSDGNYPILFDEFKPSQFDQYKLMMISETLRNSYDRHVVDRGSKDLKNNKTFALTRPMIIAGEERYLHMEKAAVDRSCIVYLSKNGRTKKQTGAMEWIKGHQKLLNKLGRSLTEEILKLSVNEYQKLRISEANQITGLEDRPLNTAINICTGIALLNILIKNFHLNGYKDYEELVIGNIKDEILDNRSDALSEVEKTLKLYDQIIGDGRISQSNIDNALRRKGDNVYIRTSEMFNQIHEYMKEIGDKKPMLELGDFKKQAKMAGYILKVSGKQVRIDDANLRFDEYDAKKLKKLGVDSIVPADLQEVAWAKNEQQVIFAKFNKKSS